MYTMVAHLTDERIVEVEERFYTENPFTGETRLGYIKTVDGETIDQSLVRYMDWVQE